MISLLVLFAAPASLAAGETNAAPAAVAAQVQPQAQPSKAIAVPRGIAVRKKPRTVEELKKSIREASDQYEKYFLSQMLKAMRATVSDKGGILPAGQGQKIFAEQLDDEYINAWNKRGGVGYSDLIYNQVLERYGAQMGILPRQLKPEGVLPLDKNRVRVMPVGEKIAPPEVLQR